MKDFKNAEDRFRTFESDFGLSYVAWLNKKEEYKKCLEITEELCKDVQRKRVTIQSASTMYLLTLSLFWVCVNVL